MFRCPIGIILYLFSTMISGQSVIGLWQSTHPKTKSPMATLEVYEKDQEVYVRIIDITDHSLSRFCDRCKGVLKNRDLTEIDVIWNLKKKNDGHYKKGQIIDPSSGNTYKCFIKLETPEILKVRAYSGLPALGKTQFWKRLKIEDIASHSE